MVRTWWCYLLACILFLAAAPTVEADPGTQDVSAEVSKHALSDLRADASSVVEARWSDLVADGEAGSGRFSATLTLTSRMAVVPVSLVPWMVSDAHEFIAYGLPEGFDLGPGESYAFTVTIRSASVTDGATATLKAMIRSSWQEELNALGLTFEPTLLSEPVEVPAIPRPQTRSPWRWLAHPALPPIGLMIVAGLASLWLVSRVPDKRRPKGRPHRS